MTRRLPHEISTNELLEIINNTPKLVEEEEKKLDVQEDPVNGDVLAFLARFNIQTGENKVKKNLLYNIYKAWSSYPIKRKDFFTIVNRYIDSATGASSYKINLNVVKLSYDVFTAFKSKYRIVTNKSRTVHFENFFNFYALKSEDYWVHINILYYLYQEYLNASPKKQRPLSYKHFIHYTAVYFKVKNTNQGKMVCVSKNIEGFFKKDQLNELKVMYAKEREKEIFQKEEAEKSKARRKKRRFKSPLQS